MSKWVWETTDPRRNGGAGDLAKLFRNENPKQPGALAFGQPSPAATLMAREVIQNSWDAAAELQRDRAETGVGAPRFGISFDFLELVGERRTDFQEAVDLSGLREQFSAVEQTEDAGKLGLAGTGSLEHVDDPEQVLQVLRIVERGTTGMYGPFESDQSKMFLALVSVGYTVKAAGAGGSYGYGKAGLIAGSAIRTVIAYSCFEPQENDLVDGVPVTRRLLGMTYWGQHHVDGVSYTGFARLGEDNGGWVGPLVNEAADEMATRLGMDIRSTHDDADLGTTFVLLDPVVEPNDLKNAIERNWWPAIKEGRFVPVIMEHREDHEPVRHVARPLQNSVIAPFVRAYELATVTQDNDVDHELRADLGKLPGRLGGHKVGMIGIVADLDGWSYATDEDDDDEFEEQNVPQSTLIALTRSPLMVVDYYTPKASGRPPFVRGVFVADDEVDDLLRQTEPKAHDAWVTSRTESDGDADHKAPEVAKHVLKVVARETRKFQERLRPPLPDPGDVRLTLLSDLFRNLARGESGERKPPPPEGERNLSIRTNLRSAVCDDPAMIRAQGSVRLALADHYERADQALVSVRIVYHFLEDGKARTICPLTFSSGGPEAETATDQAFEIEVGRDYRVIEFESEPYSIDWSGKLSVSAEVKEPILERTGS